MSSHTETIRIKGQQTHSRTSPGWVLVIVAILIALVSLGFSLRAFKQAIDPNASNPTMNEQVLSPAEVLPLGQSNTESEPSQQELDLRDLKGSLAILQQTQTADSTQITDLENRIAIQSTLIANLRSQATEHLASGGWTELGMRLNSVVKALNWQLNVKPCSEFGTQDERDIVYGLSTFVLWQGVDWAHSQCLVDVTGWNPDSIKRNVFLAVLQNMTYTGYCGIGDAGKSLTIYEYASSYEFPVEVIEAKTPQAISQLIRNSTGSGSVDNLRARTCGSGGQWGVNASSYPIRIWPLSEEEFDAVLNYGAIGTARNKHPLWVNP